MPCDTAYLNGEFLPLAQAQVPVLDRGLLFGDAVYEVIPVYAGHPFLLDAHIARLAQSLAGIRMDNPHGRDDWQAIIMALIQRNGDDDLVVYLQVTRGAPARREHRFDRNTPPNIIAFCQVRSAPDPAIFERGVAAITRDDDRWDRCEIKSTALLANVLAADDAATAGATEAILLRAGAVTEGASSNVFVVHNQCLRTPALAPSILPGITRAEILRLAKAHHFDCAQTAVSATALANADEIWLTSATREIFPVTRLDGATVGTGKPGPVWTHMRRLLDSEAYAA